MGLIDLKTDLKSLRYGKDTIGGGYSGQPYIQTPIPESFNDLGANEDFILRGGINAVRDSATDIKRLTKMFFDLKSPNGLLFIAKQNLLSQTAVRTQTSGVVNEGIYTPLNTLAQAGVLAFGYHLNKQGENPFEETGAYANNPNLYSVKVKTDQLIENNRLAELYRAISTDRSINNWNFSGFSLNVGSNVLTYDGGPNSILGVGKTNIRFPSPEQRTGKQNKYFVDNNNFFIGKNNQRSVNSDDKQVGGLQVNSEKLWTKSPQYRLPDFSVNSPQSSSFAQANDEQFKVSSATAKQDITGSKDGGKYDFYNPLRYAGISANESIYNRLLGVYESERQQRSENGKLAWTNNVYESGSLQINSSSIGPNTWTPNQDVTNPKGITYRISTPKGINYNVSGSKGVTNIFGLNQPPFVNPSVYQPSGSGQPLLSPNINKVRSTGPALNDNTFTYVNPFVNINTNKNEGKYNGSPLIQDFRKILRASLDSTTRNQSDKSGATPNAPNYSGSNAGIGVKTQIGNPGQRSGKNYVSYTAGVTGNDGGVLDKINASPIGTLAPALIGGSVNDLVTFNIAPFGYPEGTMNFRAFLGSFSDNYAASIASQQYVGRGENFYTYTGFARKISLSWTVAALSKQELIPMYKKLSYLASNTAPVYKDGFMQGPLVTLTVGGYINELPGYIEGLNLEMGDDSTWEIGINDNGGKDETVSQLTHIIKVTGFNFTPIPTYLPQRGAHFIDLAPSKAAGIGPTLWADNVISLT